MLGRGLFPFVSHLDLRSVSVLDSGAMRILVVEDSVRLREAVAKALRRSGYAVDESGDGEDALWQATEIDYDGIVLDIMLPKLDGLEVLAELRKKGKETPVLLLTARNQVQDRVTGLRAGADDYLGKPFALDELLARVDALCRRRFGRHAAVIRVGDVEIDTDARRAWRGGDPLDLTPREFRLLRIFALEQGKVLSRTQLEEHLYDELASPMSNVVDASVYQLRRKLRAAGSGTPLIHTRRGQGYVMEELSQS
jgi:DNA-binding response OmpR family regulator